VGSVAIDHQDASARWVEYTDDDREKAGHETFRDRLRAFELRLQAEMATIRMPVHLCLGQESVPAALAGVLRREDWLFTGHRNHGHYLAKGGNADRLYDEIRGRETGVCGGYMGSMGLIDPAINFYGSSIVGGSVGIAAGVAMGLKRRDAAGTVVLCVGDAVAEQGVFWESLNFIALHRLRVLIVVENNRYSVHAPLRRRQASDIGHRMRAFGVSGTKVFDALGGTEEWIFTGYGHAQNGPFFVEVMCERECAHSNQMPDFRDDICTGD